MLRKTSKTENQTGETDTKEKTEVVSRHVGQWSTSGTIRDMRIVTKYSEIPFRLVK